jgi:hypothetical protein
MGACARKFRFTKCNLGADKERQSLSLIVSADCGIFEYVKKQKAERTHCEWGLARENSGLRSVINICTVY